MTARVLILCCAVCHCAVGQTPCVAVSGAEILGADLARAIPVFRAVPSDLPITPSPLPGAVRMFPASELQTIAARFAIREVLPAETCFRIATEPLNRARIIESMTGALKIPGVRIEVLDLSNESAPVGRIDFPLENLRTPATPNRDLPVVWRGDIIYAGDRRFAIWAKVKLTAPVTRLIAVENLRMGVPIKPGQIREEVIEAFPLSPGRETTLSQIDGLVPMRAIAAGAEVRAVDVIRPNEVNRGDLVHVEVRMGAARVALTGRAESAGHMGEFVPVRNLESSRVFQARVEGKGSVTVQLGGTEEESLQ
jgi:flagella basal body P-ring formation protein FlgA